MNIKFITIVSFGLMTFATSCKSTKDTAATTYEAAESRERNTSINTNDRRGRKGPPSVDEVFKMDLDGDGFLSKSEIKGRLLESFDQIDADGDGLISKEEFEKAPKPQRGQRPQRGN